MGRGITIVGLGPWDPQAMTLEAREALERGSAVCLRTLRHPAAAGLAARREVIAFDDLYDKTDSFEDVYREIARRVVELGAGPEGVVYAVPGDPMVGEATTPAIRERAAAMGLPVRVVHAPSFLEPTLAQLGLDALDGLQVADGLRIARGHFPPLSPDRPAIIAQVYSRLVASEVKLVLLTQYPAEHRVTLIDGAGSDAVRLEELLLEDLDRRDRFSHASSVIVPPLSMPSSLEGFQETIAHLRAPDGCPWDREQSHESLRPHLMEEAYEALEAIDRGEPEELKEELGDLLLQIVLHAQIAGEGGDFTMADVIAAIQAKIIRRHPHVFGGLEVDGVEDVLHNWEGLKAGERERAGQGRGALDGVPGALPALSQALEIQGRAARHGFDWRSIDGVRRKVDEELAEVDAAEKTGDREAEVGDLLFAVVNLARWLDVDPESALRACNRRFRSRFGWMEARAAADGISLSSLGADRLDDLWERAKRSEGP